MKALVNAPENVVAEALEGMALAYPELLHVETEPRFLRRSDAPRRGKVALVSGGGSGHEPLHGGFVGSGMLDAACPGEVFTSPTPDQILAAAQAVNGGAGVLLIVKNYTGDVLNFQLAAELLAAADIPTETVLVDDDVAVTDSLYTAGRRGVGATVLIEKICGAAAEAGKSLADVARIGREVNAAARSMGLALTPCTNPQAGQPSFQLGEQEIEFGIGIHGEPGRSRIPLAKADTLTEMLLTPILADLPFRSGDTVLLFVDGLGATPLLELYIVYRAATRIAEQHGLRISRRLVGSYMTSLDMAGVAITLLRMQEDWLGYWDAPVRTPALSWGATPC
ncbi:dihydroxyacetone kinase subunit DhaK [Candidatus Igneacidithiobacillus taiwanensis]|uniref:dihydroxyacetone kinase subunit DhaK n=1 Tax=Candidatus Igneacidithiobacillus taiwanensis TaxID=1945924 RepID=UPI0028A2937E|nr:dihydroxyacetone kinase subunit DhaK [Candidatus Igneacidithiobacillus taiwanensis]MCE5359657.1 dihydroxyacetone kinase subunit DhaK [Acidithiobacillus sp.]